MPSPTPAPTLRQALAPLYRWIREQYGCDPGAISVSVGPHRLKLPPMPMGISENPVDFLGENPVDLAGPSGFSPGSKTRNFENFSTPASEDVTGLRRRVLEFLADGKQTLDAISLHIGCDRSGVHRNHIKPLLAKGFVEKSRGGGYELTLAGMAEIDSPD